MRDPAVHENVTVVAVRVVPGAGLVMVAEVAPEAPAQPEGNSVTIRVAAKTSTEGRF
jgi:hypothetical protein